MGHFVLELIQKPKIFTITDMDGVVFNPFKSACCMFKDNAEAQLQATNRVRWLVRVARRSAATAVWTSRFEVPEFMMMNKGFIKAFQFFDDGITKFPFITGPSLTRIEKLGKGTLSVVPNKYRPKSLRYVAEMIQQADPHMIYYIGSSGIDAKMLLKLMSNLNMPKEKFSFFDTGHSII